MVRRWSCVNNLNTYLSNSYLVSYNLYKFKTIKLTRWSSFNFNSSMIRTREARQKRKYITSRFFYTGIIGNWQQDYRSTKLIQRALVYTGITVNNHLILFISSKKNDKYQKNRFTRFFSTTGVLNFTTPNYRFLTPLTSLQPLKNLREHFLHKNFLQKTISIYEGFYMFLNLNKIETPELTNLFGLYRFTLFRYLKLFYRFFTILIFSRLIRFCY